MSQKEEIFDVRAIDVLQKKAKKNHSIPPSIIVKGDRRLLQYYERKIKAVSFS
jgi:hypothetical protein